jgi:ATP-dependent exoDNAse (exonuclease V) alpha subunit
MANLNPQQSKVSKEQTKIRVLAVAKILNEGRKMRIRDIQRLLELQYDIKAAHDTIMHDIWVIDRFMLIEVTMGRHGGYKKMNFDWEDEGNG